MQNKKIVYAHIDLQQNFLTTPVIPILEETRETHEQQHPWPPHSIKDDNSPLASNDTNQGEKS